MKPKKETTAQEMKRMIVELSKISAFVDIDSLESVVVIADAGKYLRRALEDDTGDFTVAEQECAIEEMAGVFHDLLIFQIDRIHSAFVKEIDSWFDPELSDCEKCDAQYRDRFAQLWTDFIDRWQLLRKQYYDDCQAELDEEGK